MVIFLGKNYAGRGCLEIIKYAGMAELAVLKRSAPQRVKKLASKGALTRRIATLRSKATMFEAVTRGAAASKIIKYAGMAELAVLKRSAP